MVWDIPKLWDGGDVFILGGGPSVPPQFGIPESLVQKVREGKQPPSVYSNYMSKLHDKHVIGINVAYMIGDWIDILFFGDHSFFLNHRSKLSEFPGIIISSNPGIDKYGWIKHTPKDANKNMGISEIKNKISWNFNSGAAAINLAYHLGAKRIILLGFDMCLTEGNQHWHDLYGRGDRLKKDPRKLPFDRHLRGFNPIEKDAKRLGVEILNASHLSVIPNFKKIHINDVL